MTCPVCGTVAVPGARYCHACGARLPDGPVEAATERRVVTVLFGDLSDFTSWAEELDPERVGQVTDRVLAECARIVSDYGGHVDKLTGDGIMAVFGAPVAHEDDAERAVRAAAAMQTAVRALVDTLLDPAGPGRPLGLRVGLNTGEVVAGVQAHLSYTVVGDTVNTAARLSDAATIGAVYAGRLTADDTREVAAWRELRPLRLKGKREPVVAYQLLHLRTRRAARPGIGDEARFVGREAEIGRLLGIWHDAADRREQRVSIVVGEAGIGKTRLAREFAAYATDPVSGVPGARVLRARCAPYGEGRELAPLAELARRGCLIPADATADIAGERVRRTAARLRLPPDTVGQLRVLFGLDSPAVDGPREAVAPGTQPPVDPLLDAVVTLLQGLANENPLLVVVDDTHWAGPTLRTALGDLTRRLTGPVLTLMLGRPEVVRTGTLAQLNQAEVLNLPPLSGAAASRLLRAYLGGELSARDEAELLGRAQGNPFFLAELVTLLVERGQLRQAADGGWRLSPGSVSGSLPQGVQAVLSARIDVLPSIAKDVLRDVAVVGNRAPLDVLVALHGDEAAVRAAVDELVAREMLRPTRRGDYAFVHALAREAAYNGLGKAERAHRHATVARWAATVGENALAGAHAEHAIQLATEMALPSGDPALMVRQDGVDALGRLGEAAEARGDTRRAVAAFARAVALTDRRSCLAPRHRVAYGRALLDAGRHAEARDAVTELLDSDQPEIRAAALRIAGAAYRMDGAFERAAENFHAALRLAERHHLDQAYGDALRSLGLLDYFTGRLRKAERRFREARDFAERVGDAPGKGWALQNLAWSATSRGDYATANEALRRGAAVFRALGDNSGLSWCAGTEGFVRLLQGRFRQARRLAGALLSRGEGLGDQWGLAALLTIDALAAAELGQLSEARERAQRALDEFAVTSDPWGRSIALVTMGVIERGCGRQPEAIGTLDEAVELAGRTGHPLAIGLALTSFGYCQLDVGAAPEAEKAARRALDTLDQVDLEPAASVGATVLLAQARRNQGDLASALDLLATVVAEASEPSLLFPRRQALAHYSGTLLAAGFPEEALYWARAARDVPAEDVRARIVSLRALANALAATGDLEEALATVDEAHKLAHSTEQLSERPATEAATERIRALVTS
ncbi:MAG: AAA family ATPase [Mycobacteriales bacterium]